MGPLLIGLALVLAPEAFGHHDCCYFFALVQSMRWIGSEELRRDAGSVAPKARWTDYSATEFRDSEYGAQTAYSLRNLEDEKVNWVLALLSLGALSPRRRGIATGTVRLLESR